MKKSLSLFVLSCLCCLGALAQWSVIPTGENKALLDLHFEDASNGIVVGDSGALLMTTDGGQNWTTPNAMTTEKINGVARANADDVLAVCNAGVLIESSNSGSSWSASGVKCQYQLKCHPLCRCLHRYHCWG